MRQNSSPAAVNSAAARLLLPLLIALLAVAAVFAGTGLLGAVHGPAASVSRPLADVGWNGSPTGSGTPSPTPAP